MKQSVVTSCSSIAATLLTLLTLVALLFSAPAKADEPSFEYLEGADNSSIEDALKSTGWRREQGHASFGYHGKGIWLRYDVARGEGTWIFVISNPWLTRFDAYAVADGKVVRKFETGSTLPMSSRPIKAPSFAFPIAPEVDTYYVYDYGNSSATFPARVMKGPEYLAHNNISHSLHGLYYGIVLFMILYNLAIFAGTRDTAYLYYVGYAVSLIGFLATADGTGMYYLWPESPSVQQAVAIVSFSAGLIFISQFAIRFLDTRSKAPRLTRVLHVLQIIIGVQGLLTVLFPGFVMYGMRPVVALVTLIALVAITVVRVIQNAATAKVFFFANGMIVVGGVVLIGVQYGLIQPGYIVQHAVHIGSVLELAFLSGALILRLRSTESLRWRAYNRAQKLSRRNQELQAAQTMAEERAQIQRSLQQAQKLKTIGQMAGGFAHDFNNILASILGFSELAIEKSNSADRTRLVRYLREIKQAGERGASLVRQLLVYSQNTQFQPRELNLNDTVRQAIELLRGSLPATVALNADLPSKVIVSHIDPEQVQQVLVNLSLNAAEATNERGRIDIRVEQVEIAELNCTSCLERFSGPYIAIKVEDNGPGIDGNAEELFTPFHTTKTVGQGSGLGLSVVHGIVHEHHGHIHAANRAEGGARFVAYLPQTPQLVAEVPQKKRVLVIEDDPSVAAYLEELLDQESFATTIAKMPTEALEVFLAEPDAFDLVITDYAMPEGTGIELAEDMRAMRPDLPVILTTGNKNSVKEQELVNAGIRAVFTKPLNSDQLLAKIRGLLAT